MWKISELLCSTVITLLKIEFQENLGYSCFSTLLLFRLLALTQTKQPLTKPDTARLLAPAGVLPGLWLFFLL